MKNTRATLFIIFSLSLVVRIHGEGIFSEPKLPKPIFLLINSYAQGMPWIDGLTKGILEEITTHFPEVELYIEYLDWKRFPNKSLLANIKELLAQKYSSRLPVLIITTDDEALKVGLALRKEWKLSIPLISGGVSKPAADIILAKESNVGGVYEAPDIEKTISFLMQVKPHTQVVYLITDNTETGAGFRSQVQAFFKKNNPNVFLRDFSKYTFKQIKDTLAVADPRSAALIISYYQPYGSLPSLATDWSERLVNVSRVPLFGVHDYYLNHGILGGRLLNAYLHGKILGTQAVKAYQKGIVDPIRFSEEDKNSTIDYSLLARYDLRASDFPQGTQWINHPVSFFESYPELAWGTVIIFILLLTLVFVLTINILYRRKMALVLKEWNDNLSKMVEERTAELIETRDELVRSEKQLALSHLVVGISHKLNTPLGNALTASSLLNERLVQLKEGLGKDLDTVLKILRSSIEELMTRAEFQGRVIQQAVELVNRFRQVDVFRQDYVRGEFKVSTFFDNFLVYLGQYEALRRLQLSCEANPDLVISSFETVLSHVIYDLVENCHLHAYPVEKFPKGSVVGPVILKAFREQDEVVFYVEDFGAGIPLENQPKIFEPFFTTALTKGTGGLGLTICEALVGNILGGTIELKQKEGPGSLFAVRFKG